MPVYASSIFWDSPEATANIASDLVERGFGFIKVKEDRGLGIDIKGEAEFNMHESERDH